MVETLEVVSVMVPGFKVRGKERERNGQGGGELTCCGEDRIGQSLSGGAITNATMVTANLGGSTVEAVVESPGIGGVEEDTVLLEMGGGLGGGVEVATDFWVTAGGGGVGAVAVATVLLVVDGSLGTVLSPLESDRDFCVDSVPCEMSLSLVTATAARSWSEDSDSQAMMEASVCCNVSSINLFPRFLLAQVEATWNDPSHSGFSKEVNLLASMSIISE